MLKQGNCIKRFTAVSTDKLEANAGESLIIRGLYVAPETDNKFLVLKVNRKTVGVYRIYGKSGNHLDVLRTGYIHKNLMEYLTSKGVICTIPIAEGQSFTVSSIGTSPEVVIVFDRYDAGDIRADMPNGSASLEYVFMQYMNVGTGLTASGDALFDVSLSPAEFPDFPAGKVVPANHEITLLGLAGYPWLDPTDQSGGYYTNYIKLVKEREVLFDEDRNGIPFKCGIVQGMFTEYNAAFTLIGAGHIVNTSRNYAHGEPLIFDPPVIFVAGVELNLYVNCTLFGSPGSWTTTVPDLACILKVAKV